LARKAITAWPDFVCGRPPIAGASGTDFGGCGTCAPALAPISATAKTRLDPAIMRVIGCPLFAMMNE